MTNTRYRSLMVGLLVLALVGAGCGSLTQAPPTATPLPPTPTPTTIPPTPTVVPPAPTAVPPTATPRPPVPTPSLEEKVDIGGRSLYISCQGEGSPAVITDAGLDRNRKDWMVVQRKIAYATRVCVYDRAGLGQSDPRPTRPCTAQDQVDDLHALLTEARISGPYILAVHSLTGLNARLYASQYPDDVVGMVLVDVTHPDQADRFRAALPEESPSESVALKLFRQDTAFTVRGTEQVDLGASCAQVRVTGSLGNIPLVVLTRSVPAFGDKGLDPDLGTSIEQEWVRMQQELAELSSRGVHMVVPDSSHMIQLDQPQAVADAILSVLAQVRGAQE